MDSRESEIEEGPVDAWGSTRFLVEVEMKTPWKAVFGFESEGKISSISSESGISITFDFLALRLGGGFGAGSEGSGVASLEAIIMVGQYRDLCFNWNAYRIFSLRRRTSSTGFSPPCWLLSEGSGRKIEGEEKTENGKKDG